MIAPCEFLKFFLNRLFLFLLALVCGIFFLMPAQAGYKPPVIKPAIFSEDGLGMIPAERNELATRLATYAVEWLRQEHIDEESGELGEDIPAEDWEKVRKLLGLSLHLNPRDRAAVIANHMLQEGRLPRQTRMDLSPAAFSSLIHGRAMVFFEQGGVENRRLGAHLLELAVLVDPANEDAVYDYEVARLEGLSADWRPILVGVEEDPEG